MTSPAPDSYADPVSALRRGLFAYVASVLATTVLFSVLHGSHWFLESLGGITLVAAVGIAGRALRVPWWLIALLQVAGTVGYLTASFVAKDAWLQVIPTRASLRALWHLAVGANAQMHSISPPVHPTRELTLAAVGLATMAALLVDVLAVQVQQRALAGAPLLIFELVPVAYEKESALLFLTPAIAYLVLLSDALDRLAPRIGAAVVSVSLVVPIIAPKFSPEYDLHRGVGTGTGTITTLNPLVTMRQDLVRSADVDLLNIRTDSAHPGDVYLRTVTLDTFDGIEWKAGKREVRTFDGSMPAVPGLSGAVSTTPVQTVITASNHLESDYLPMAYPTTKVKVDGQWRLDPLTDNVVSHQGRGQITGHQYTVSSLDLAPSRTDIGGAVPVTPYLRPYLQLPVLPPAVKQTATKIAQGANGAFEIGLALQEWFRRPGNFTYDLSVRSGTGNPDILHFLAVRRGYCEQFAATMAAMARLLGVPARVDVGFTSGRLADDGISRIVSAHDAHAWPELWLPNIGWYRFEPTPGTAASNPTPPSWMSSNPKTDQAPGASSGNDAFDAQQAAAGGGGGSSGGSAPGAETAEGQSVDPGHFDCKASPNSPKCVAPPPDPDASHSWHWLAVFGILALILAIIGPALTRAVVRRRRWAIAAGLRAAGPDAVLTAEIAWRELRDGALDLGFLWPAARTPRQSSATLVAEAKLTPAGAAAVHQVTSTVERTRYSRESGAVADAAQLRSAVIRIHRELAQRSSLLWRVRAVVLPRSVWPMVRAALDRAGAWSAAMVGRTRATLRPNRPTPQG
jgi:transglutaminase-like putative cysteine protease